MNKNKDFIPVDSWTEGSDVIVYPSGNLMVVPFSKYFGEEYEDGNFIIKKKAYVHRLTEYHAASGLSDRGICHYINYFLKYYDTDKELIVSYLRLKYLIDKKSTKFETDEFIKLLQGVLFSDTMRKKIYDMVEDNYMIDLTPEKRDYEQLEFNNDHAKAMMEMSVAMRLMVAPMFHFICTNNLLKKESIIFDFYKPLFETFNRGYDIYTKLWYTVRARVQVSIHQNKPIWDQQEAIGEEPQNFAETLLKQYIISDSMFKYSFDKNVISFNSVVMNQQIIYFTKQPYDYTQIEIDNVKDSEGLSGLDKLEMNSYKVDESLAILSRLNTKQVVESVCKGMYSDEELSYYKRYLRIDKFQVDLVNYYYSSYMGYNDLNLLTRTQHLKLLIALKKRLQYQGQVYLPLLLTSNIENMSKRTINNQKFTNKIETSDLFINMMENKFSVLKETENKGNFIIKILSTLLNSTFRLVDFDNPEKLGMEIEVNADILSAEFLEYVSLI